MANTQTFSIKLTANGKEVKELMDALKKQADDYEKELVGINEQLKERDKLTKEEIKTLEKQSDSLTAKIKALNTAVEENITNMRKIGDVMRNLAGSSGGELGKALRGLGQQFKSVSDQTLKAGETMEQKLTEIKEKMIEVRHEMAKREGVDAMKRAKATLTELANTPLDKLKMGLESIEKKLSTMSDAEHQAADGLTLLQGRAQYKAQIAVNEYGRAGSADISKMNAEQLRAEQQRLRQGYMATEGAKGYESVSQEYLNRLQQVNQTIKERAEAERIADKATRERIATQEQEKQVVDVLTRVNQQQKVTLDELRTAEKNLQDQIARMEGQNLPFADQNKLLQAKASLQDIQETISHITLDSIDFDSLENEPVERLEKLLKQLEADEKRLAATDKQASEQMAANKRKVQQAIQKVKNQTIDLADAQKVAGERGKHSVQDMQRAYDTLKQHLATLSTSQRMEIAETRQQMKQLKADIESVTGAVSNQNSIWKTAVRNITAYVGVFGAFNFIKNKITEVIRGGAELSDQMAKIRMVSGLAMEEIEDLTRSLAKLDTRTTLTELNELAYIGSKLGFGEMGVGALEEFAKAANQVNVALKEDLGNEAMTALSKITENMGLIKKMGVEQALLSTSSAMFKLFTSSTAAAGPIVEVTKRLAPMAQISGFATHEILALASASDALMQSEEVAGTAMSKFMMAMQNNHNVIEKTLGMTEGSIATMMKSGKSMEAFLTILDRMSGKNVTELQNVWKLLGSEGDRLIRVILAMANHTELVRQHLDTSAKAFKEATAVTEEYNIQQETAMAYLERANNKIRNAFINPDSSLAVKEMTKAWYDFVKSITDSDLALSSILTSINALLFAMRALIALLPGITFGLMAKGARMLYDNMKLANIATEGFITSWKKMDAATKSNWIGLIVGSLVQVVYWIKQFSSSISDAEKEQMKLNDAIENMHEKADVEIKSLDRLKKQLDDTNISQEERNALLSKVRKDYDIYLNYLGIEKSKVVDLTKHYDALVKVMKQRFAYQEREDYKRDVMGGEDGIRMQRRKASASLKKQATDMGIKELDVDTEVMPLLRQGWSVDQVMDVIAPDLKRAADNISKSESAARTFAGPGAAVGKRSNQNQKYLDLKSSFQKFADAVQREQKMEADIDAAFASEIGDFDYDKWLRTQVMGEFKVEPPKGGTGDKGNGKDLREKFKDAKEAATGIISKLEEYYRLQEAAINDARADGQLTEEQAKEMVRALSIVKNESLATARRAVTTGDTKDWDELKTKVLPAVMSDTSEVSKNLLSTIQQVAVDKLHADLEKFNGSSDVLGLDSRAFFDQMNAKAAGNTREAARLKAKLFTQAETMVKQYRIFDQAVDKMRDDVEQMGFITETYEEFAERMRLGIEKKPDNVIKLSSGQRQARQQMTDRFNATQGIGTEKPQDMGEWFKEFTDNGKEEWMRALPELQKWVMDTDKYKDQINNLYELLKKVQRGESIQMTAEQLAPTNTQIDEAVSTHISDKEAYAAMGFKFLGQGTVPYRINIENGDEALEWMRQFGTTASGELEVWAQAIPELEKWVTLLQRKAELQKEGKDLTADELAELQNAIPQIQALYYKMNEFSDKVPESISKQVQQMTGRKPIGMVERGEQHEAQVDLTTQLYDNKINEARSSGNEDAALELEEQKKQALIDLERQYQQELWQIREQMGVNVFEQYENEVAGYKNMLDKKLITEKQFQQKKGQLQMKLGLDVAQQYNNMMSNMVNALQEAEIASVEAKYDAEINAAKANGQDTAALEEQKEAEIMEIRKKYAGMQFAVKISEIIANTAVAIMQAYAQLGPIGGSIAAAMLTATGAAQLALAKAEYDKVMGMQAGGSKKSTSSAKTNTKLVSGMLTYDRGNVDKFAGRRKLYDDGETQVYGRRRYLGEDGKVYTASAEPAPKDGLITHPIATTVQGQPALVAENGPEIVIGRETTKAIMMNEPELIRYLANYQQHGGRRLFDSGNVQSAAGTQPSDLSPQTSDAAAERQALINRLDRSDALMEQVLYFLQNPIAPEIAMYDTGGKKGLRSKMKEADRFMARYGG